MTQHRVAPDRAAAPAAATASDRVTAPFAAATSHPASAPTDWALLLPDPPATDALGAALARSVPRAASAASVVYLSGELGAGKSHCARSLLRALGVTGTIRSPTYTLVETYDTPGLTCLHLDLYRLQTPLEAAELDLAEYLGPGHLVLVEWPEKGGGNVPRSDLVVELAYSQAARLATIRASSDAGRGWLAELVKDSSLNRYVAHLT